jgi:hypothetical protein
LRRSAWIPDWWVRSEAKGVLATEQDEQRRGGVEGKAEAEMEERGDLERGARAV